MVDFAKMKKAAKAEVAAPAPAAATEEKVYPVFSLTYKEDNDGELTNLTGLFERKTKKGDTYYSGFSKDIELGFTIFENKDGYILKVNAKGEKSETVCTMKKMEKGHLFGRAEDGRLFNAFPFKPKEK